MLHFLKFSKGSIIFTQINSKGVTSLDEGDSAWDLLYYPGASPQAPLPQGPSLNERFSLRPSFKLDIQEIRKPLLRENEFCGYL